MATTDPDEKVLGDLATLAEKIALCQSMLPDAGGPAAVDADGALLTVIGFLEACAPRVVELIEAAAQGALREDTLARCLVVNDQLTTLLADVDKEPKERRSTTPAAALPAAVDAAPSAEVERGMDELTLDAAAGGNTSGAESAMGPAAAAADPFGGGLDLLAPSPAAASDPFAAGNAAEAASPGTTAAAASTLDNDDDFDAFFRDRTSAP